MYILLLEGSHSNFLPSSIRILKTASSGFHQCSIIKRKQKSSRKCQKLLGDVSFQQPWAGFCLVEIKIYIYIYLYILYIRIYIQRFVSKSWWCLACILVQQSARTPSKTHGNSGNQTPTVAWNVTQKKKASSMEEMPEYFGPEDVV